MTISEKDIIFGIQGNSDAIFCLNFVILHAKSFIYMNRINNNHVLLIASFKAQLKRKLEIEKIISKQNKPESFIKFQSLLEEL